VPNTLYEIIPKILAGAADSLRETCIVPRLVNGNYSQDAAAKGSVVEVPIPTAIAARDVVPAAYAPDPSDLTIPTAKIPLNFWQEAPFVLTDRDISNVMDGVVPMQVTEAGKTIANAIDRSLLNLYKYAFNYVGTPGVTPFATDTVVAQLARRALNLTTTPPQDRRIVLDVDADANATGLPAFQSADRSGTVLTIQEGAIGRKLGFDWFYDQLMPSHLPQYHGRSTASPTGYLVNQANHAIGMSEVTLDTGTGTIVEGDLFRVAGDSQSYVVRAINGTTIQYLPKSKTAMLDNAAVTFVPDHAINLGFHRDAIGLAVRSLSSGLIRDELGGSMSAVYVDPISQIPLRLEVTNEHKRTRWAIDALWGVGVIRPECIVRIVG
jgi:hypothetical protein